MTTALRTIPQTYCPPDYKKPCHSRSPEKHSSFSQTVRATTLSLLQPQSRLPIHMVGDASVGSEEIMEVNDSTLSEFLGAIEDADGDEIHAANLRFKKKFGTNWRDKFKNKKPTPTTTTTRPQRERPTTTTTTTTAARKCINCSSTDHKTNECPLPRDDTKRKCHTCGKGGHYARDCTSTGALKNVNGGGARPSLGEMQMVGYQVVKNGNTPVKQPVTLAMFANDNSFKAFANCANASGKASEASKTADMSDVDAD